MYKIIIYIKNNHKKDFLKMIILLVLASAAEFMTVGAVIPFLAIIVKEDLISSYLYFDKDVIVGLFCAVAILSSYLRYQLFQKQVRLSHNIGAKLGYIIYKNIINKSYEEYSEINSSDVISNLTLKIDKIIHHACMPAFMFAGSIIMLASIVLILAIINKIVTISIVVIFALIYISIGRRVKNKIENYSRLTNACQNMGIKIIQDSLRNIKEIKISGAEGIYSSEFFNNDRSLKDSQSNVLILGGGPKYIIEGMAISFLVLMAVFLEKTTGNESSTLITVGAFAMAGQRMMPLVQQIYMSLTMMKGSRDNLDQVIRDYEEALQGTKEKKSTELLELNNKILLQRISYKYKKSTKFALECVNCEINSGDIVAIFGKTGSGKSTLVDLITGLLEPTSGFIYVDGEIINEENKKAWQNNIAYVPQNIFLIDDSIEKNITMSEKMTGRDNEYLVRAIKDSCVYEFSKEKEDGVKFIVGENGAKLSGGQRQRIGIARALFKNKKLIVLDEATSALDDNTAKKVIENITKNRPDTTVIIVTHNLSHLKLASKILEMKNGRLVQFREQRDENLLLKKIETCQEKS